MAVLVKSQPDPQMILEVVLDADVLFCELQLQPLLLFVELLLFQLDVILLVSLVEVEVKVASLLKTTFFPACFCFKTSSFFITSSLRRNLVISFALVPPEVSTLTIFDSFPLSFLSRSVLRE